MLWSQAIAKNSARQTLLKKSLKDTSTSDLHQDYCTIFYKCRIWALIKFAVKLNTCITFPWTCQTGFQVTL